MDHCIITDAYTPYCGNFSSIPVVEYTDETTGTDSFFSNTTIVTNRGIQPWFLKNWGGNASS